MLDLGEQHLGKGLFVKNTILFAFHRQADVYAATLRRRNFRIQAVSTEEDLSRISRVKLDCGSGAGDLKRK